MIIDSRISNAEFFFHRESTEKIEELHVGGKVLYLE